MGLVSRLSLASHLDWPIPRLTQGPSWWRTHLSVKMDFSVRASERLAGHIVSSLLLLAPPEFWLVELHSLSGPPTVRQLRQAVIIIPGQGGQFWSTVP